MAKIAITLKDEGGQRVKAESILAKFRTKIHCSTCFRIGRIQRDQASEYRRFRCAGCRVTFGVREFMERFGYLDTDIDQEDGTDNDSVDVTVNQRKYIKDDDDSVSATENEDTDEADLSAFKKTIKELSDKVERLEKELLTLKNEDNTRHIQTTHAMENGKPTFAEIVKKTNVPWLNRGEAVKSLSVLKKQNLNDGCDPLVHEVDIKHSFRRVYVSGLPYMPISELKKHLFNLRFRLSLIKNISYIGQNIIEFTLCASYSGQFSASSRRFDLQLLTDYSPCNYENCSAEIQQSIQNAFKKRIEKIALSSSNDAIKSYFLDLQRELLPKDANVSHGEKRTREMVTLTPIISVIKKKALFVPHLDEDENKKNGSGLGQMENGSNQHNENVESI